MSCLSGHQHVPSLLFAGSILLWYLGGPGKESFNVLLGTYFGWLYLRYVRLWWSGRCALLTD